MGVLVSHEAGCRDSSITLSRAKGVIGRILTFAGYVHHYIIKFLSGNIFVLILKKTRWLSLTIIQDFCTF